MATALTVQTRLHTLRDLLRRLTLEELATRAVNPEKASHLADAIVDCGVLIARLEADAYLPLGPTPSDRRPHFEA